MVSGFELALGELCDEGKLLSGQLLARLSGLSRAERDAFVQCWQGLNVERRREAIAKMVELAEESFEIDFMVLFRSCLEDADSVVRQHAIEGLWEDETANLVEPLLRLFSTDPDAGVRAAAAMSLGRFVFLAECDELDAPRMAKIRQALERAIEDPQEDPEVIRRAIESIAYINDERVRGIIDRAYEQGDSRMRESAVFAMGRSADLIWSETVLEELQDTSAAMRYEAVRACGELQLKRAVGPLIRLVQDPDREIQGLAIWSLGQIGGERARIALGRFAESDDELLSTAALEALDELEFAVRPMDLLVYEVDETGYTEFEIMDEEGSDELGELAHLDDEDGEWADDVLGVN